MANRILLGKSTNTNLGHSGGKFGLYISANGKDVTSCNKNELIFNTDNVGNASGAIDVGLFQNVPLIVGGNEVRTADFSASAGSTASLTTKNLGAGSIIYGKVTTTMGNDQSGTANSSGFTSATTATVSNTNLVDPDEGTVPNVFITGKVAVIKFFNSASALF